MADLENLLLEAARRKTTSGGRHNSSMRAKRRHEGSYSDEPGYSKSSSDEDSNDPGFGHRKPSGSQNLLKKRFDTSEKDDDTGHRDEGHDDGGGHDYSDSDSSDVGSDLYKDDYDREKLSKLTELEREMILADRAESRDDILKKKKGVSWQVEKKVRPAKEVIRLPGGRTASTTTKPGKSEYKDAFVELAARRKAQDASIQRKKRDSTTRGDRQYSPKRKVTIASPVSDSPPGRGRGKSVDSGAREEDEDRSEESKEANASSHGSNMDESDDDGPESGVKSATFEDIKTITVRHSRLFEWFLEPFFEDVIVGCFIRVAIGMSKTGHDIHKLCVVRNVDVHSYGRDESYKFENKTTNKYLMCVRGNEALAARWEMTRVSESPPLEEEFTELLQEIERDGGHIPTKDEVLQKREGFEKIINYATVKRMLQEKKSASLRPTNVATEKEHLRKELEVAMGKDNHYEVQRIKARLQALEAMSRQVKDKDSKALKLAEGSRDDILKKKKRVSWQVEKKVHPTKEVAPLPGGRTASTTTKHGKSEYKDALVELAARRKAQDAASQQKKRDSTTRGDCQYSLKRKATIASLVNDRPPGRGRGKSVDSGVREEDEDRSEESKEARASIHGSNMDESDDDGLESGTKSATFEDIKTITVRRSRLFKWFLKPFFEDVIVGCFIRVAIGMYKTGHDIYKLCVVRNVDVRSYGRDESYKFENKTTNKYLMCVRGNEAFAARWGMTRVSESPPLEEEFTELLQEIERDGGHIPTKDEVLQKRQGIEKIINSATVKRMLQEKKSASLRPTNVATEKDHLRKELEVAMGKDNHYELQRIKARLQALEAMSRHVKDKDSKAVKLAEMNRKKRQENFKNASELKPVNTSLKAGDASYDPFSRRWTRSTNYYMPSSSTPVPEGDAKEATGEHQKAGEGETAAAGAGKLMDTKAPVDAGTELHLLHDFDLPISPTGLQKFDGPQGAFSAFMEKKQRVEATLGVKVPVNDGRRHALTLTVCDYKGRRGLL